MKTYEKHGLRKHPLYEIWSAIKSRCNNPNNKNHRDYGGRGITICNEWENSFLNFYNWSIENGYINGLTIDRENNDKNYSPNNCRFVTMIVQACNNRTKSTNTSGIRGVSLHKRYNKWQAYISVNKKRIYLGRFDTKEEASMTRINYIKKHNLIYKA